MRSPPTRRQVEILRAVLELTTSRGFPPTVRELGVLIGVKSTNGVNDHLKALSAKGLVSRTSGVARSLVLTEAGRDLARGGR